MSGSLDTNIVLRLMRHDIPEQTRQAAELLDSVDEPFEVADIVFRRSGACVGAILWRQSANHPTASVGVCETRLGQL